MIPLRRHAPTAPLGPREIALCHGGAFVGDGSYPFPEDFIEAFNAHAYETALAARAFGLAPTSAFPVVLDVHLPWRSAPTTAVARALSRNRSASFARAIISEISLHVGVLGGRRQASALRLVGAATQIVDDLTLERIVAALDQSFGLTKAAGRECVVHVSALPSPRLSLLKGLGFQHLTIVLDDSIPSVRGPTNSGLAQAVDEARVLGFSPIKLLVDLASGLARDDSTVEELCQLRPERVVLLGCTQIQSGGSALIGVRRVCAMATDRLDEAGYVRIGLDTFVLADDELAAARRQGRLHRDVRGYGTDRNGDLIGLGPGAVGLVSACYTQNARTLRDYIVAIGKGTFATSRGLALDRDALLRHTVINALFCSGRVDFAEVSCSHLVDPRECLRRELAALAPYVKSGWVALDGDSIEVLPLGQSRLMAIASVFDRNHQARVARERFSRVI